MTPKNPRRSFRLDSYGPRVDAADSREDVKAAIIVRRALTAYFDGPGVAVAPSEQLAALADQLSQLRADLARVGGDLNQIAHAFNIDEPLD